MLGAGLGIGDLGGGDGLGRRRRVLEEAEAVEHLQGRQHLGRGRRVRRAALAVADQRLAGAARAAEAGDAAHHLHEQARQRQVRPVRVGGDMEEDHLAVAALGRGDQRRAVLQARPHLHLGPEPGRIGQHLLVDQHLGRRRQSGEQAVVAEGCQRLRRCPGQGAAQRSPAEPQAARAAGRRRPSPGAGRRSARGCRPSSPTARRAP